MADDVHISGLENEGIEKTEETIAMKELGEQNDDNNQNENSGPCNCNNGGRGVVLTVGGTRIKKLQKGKDKTSDIPDDYGEAWYELGAPIPIPFIRYLISTIPYILDNFFLMKNIYNAITEEDPVMHPQLVAGILGLHVMSSALISLIDSLNKDAISGRRGRYLNTNHKMMIFLRMVAHFTLTMKLFRYTTMYLENRRRNEQLHKIRMKRIDLSEKEIEFVVQQKKNQLIESHYDLVESFFKVIPAALLQVYFMFRTNPDARLRLYTTVDQDRFATVFFTVVTASISAACYQCDYLTYKKVLHFQDSFRSRFKHEINLVIPTDLFLVTNVPVQFLTIGIRVCFYSVIIFWSPYQFVVTLTLIFSVNWLLVYVYNESAWRFRPVLENPLFGTPWFAFDVIDAWVNLFVPGVHYPKPLDLFLNFYTTLLTGVIIFGGFDFLKPTSTGNQPVRIQNPQNHQIPSTLAPGQIIGASDALNYFNMSASSSQDYDESFLFIGTVVRILITFHEYITFNGISYSAFFYNVVKFMNVVNAFVFAYTCLMNYMKMYDLDFPVQIVNNFYLPLLTELMKVKDGEVRNLMKHETFLVFSMLSNSRFFGNLDSMKRRNWTSLERKDLDNLVSRHLIMRPSLEADTQHTICYFWLDKFFKLISPVLYPGRFREPDKFQWTSSSVVTDKDSILNSLAEHPLKEQLTIFVHDIYDYLDTHEKRLLLASFCSKYNDIVRHYTSLRIKRTFEFLEIPVMKGEAYPSALRARDFKRDYEIGYLQRLLREIKKVDRVFDALII